MSLTCGGGLGVGAFGTMPFATGYGLVIEEVRVSSRNSVDVTFSSPPRAFNDAATDDALNPDNWSFSLLEPFGAVLPLVQTVLKRSSVTFRIYGDQDFAEDARYGVTVSATVETMDGSPIDPDCVEGTFVGLGLVVLPPSAAQAEQPSDLNNPQVPRDQKGITQDALGTFQLTATGDYALESGRSYLRKRIIRRATTGLGDFFHLPNYGFAPAPKGLITTDLLRRIQARAMEQVLLEPDVVSANVTVSANASRPEIVTINIRVRDKLGATEDLSVPVTLYGS